MGTHEGVPYVVTELLEGETLRELVSRRAPTQRQVLFFLSQAAHGLEAAHAKGRARLFSPSTESGSASVGSMCCTGSTSTSRRESSSHSPGRTGRVGATLVRILAGDYGDVDLGGEAVPAGR